MVVVVAFAVFMIYVDVLPILERVDIFFEVIENV
jgi:hypothetical protein